MDQRRRHVSANSATSWRASGATPFRDSHGRQRIETAASAVKNADARAPRREICCRTLPGVLRKNLTTIPEVSRLSSADGEPTWGRTASVTGALVPGARALEN